MTSDAKLIKRTTKDRPLCIIPARAGSKRLKNKNMALLNGKPLVEYTIEVAVDSDLFSLIIVSSDSREILEIAYKHWNGGLVQPHKRPSALAGDNIELKTVCRFILGEYKPCEEFALLQPTNPFRTASDIRNAYTLFIEKDASYVASIANGVPDGSIIFAKTNVFLKEFGLAFFNGSKVEPYILEKSVDIHTAEDLAYAENLMKNER